LLLLVAYSMGLAVPFILAALMVERFLKIFARIKTQMVWVQRIAGVLLLCVGVLMVTGYMAILSSMMQSLTPDFIKNLL
jgi:cytochrome c-type biogenesis protein